MKEIKSKRRKKKIIVVAFALRGDRMKSQPTNFPKQQTWRLLSLIASFLLLLTPPSHALFTTPSFLSPLKPLFKLQERPNSPLYTPELLLMTRAKSLLLH